LDFRGLGQQAKELLDDIREALEKSALGRLVGHHSPRNVISPTD